MSSILCTVTTDLQAKNANGYAGVQKHTEHDPNINHSNHDINFNETQFNVYNDGPKARKAVADWNNERFSDYVRNHDDHQRDMGHPERCYNSVNGYLKNRRKATGVLTIGNMDIQARLIERFCPSSAYDVEVLADGSKHAKFKLYDDNNNPIDANIAVAKQFYQCFTNALIKATANNVGWTLKSGQRINVGEYLHRGRYAVNNDEMGMSHIHYELATYGLTRGGKKSKPHATSSLNRAIVSLHEAVIGKSCSGREAITWYRAQIDKYALICLERELHHTFKIPKKVKILEFERKKDSDPSTQTGLSMTQLKNQKQELAEHQQRVQQLQKQATDLDIKNKTAQAKIDTAQKINAVAQDVKNDVNNAYSALTGQQFNNSEASLLDVAKAVKTASDAIKKDADDNRQRLKRQKQRIAQQQAELARLRTQQNAIAHSNKKLQEDNKRLRDSNSQLEERLEYLKNQVQTAGLVIGKWVKRNWNKLEKHFKRYATYINDANNERLHGGPDGHGDVYQANNFEKEAKNGLISAFNGIQKEELQKSGFFDKVVKTDNQNKAKDTEIEK